MPSNSAPALVRRAMSGRRRPVQPAAGGGYMTLLGDTGMDDPMLAQIYTHPASAEDRQGAIDRLIEAEVTDATCGREVTAQTLQVTRGAEPAVSGDRDGPARMRQCGPVRGPAGCAGRCGHGGGGLTGPPAGGLTLTGPEPDRIACGLGAAVLSTIRRTMPNVPAPSTPTCRPVGPVSSLHHPVRLPKPVLKVRCRPCRFRPTGPMVSRTARTGAASGGIRGPAAPVSPFGPDLRAPPRRTSIRTNLVIAATPGPES